MRVAVGLQAAAERVMLENGFEVGIAAGVPQQLADLERHPPLVPTNHHT